MVVLFNVFWGNIIHSGTVLFWPKDIFQPEKNRPQMAEWMISRRISYTTLQSVGGLRGG